MAVLQLLSEEVIQEENLQGYLEDLYKVVCVSERLGSRDHPGHLVRATYVVDWEQLVHLLEDYSGFGEDIVQVGRVSGDEARVLRHTVQPTSRIARA